MAIFLFFLNNGFGGIDEPCFDPVEVDLSHAKLAVVEHYHILGALVVTDHSEVAQPSETHYGPLL